MVEIQNEYGGTYFIVLEKICAVQYPETNNGLIYLDSGEKITHVKFSDLDKIVDLLKARNK